MIDLDLRDFDNSKDKLDDGLNKILRKVRAAAHGYPTVLWTGNGYHIYQPMEGFILEEEDRFARLKESDGKDLTSEFMQFAEEFLTKKKGDPQHNPSVNSCLVRIPGTINSKCGREVKLMQRWDGRKPAIQYLLRDFRIWLINKRLEQSKSTKRARSRTTNSTTIQWIEKLLQTPLNDYRKFAVWRILAPYLINIKKSSAEETTGMIKNWLDKCSKLRPLDFNPDYAIKNNIKSATRSGYLPTSLRKLKVDNA
jgi:hypothetical protein